MGVILHLFTEEFVLGRPQERGRLEHLGKVGERGWAQGAAETPVEAESLGEGSDA